MPRDVGSYTPRINGIMPSNDGPFKKPHPPIQPLSSLKPLDSIEERNHSPPEDGLLLAPIPEAPDAARAVRKSQSHVFMNMFGLKPKARE